MNFEGKQEKILNPTEMENVKSFKKLCHKTQINENENNKILKNKNWIGIKKIEKCFNIF